MENSKENDNENKADSEAANKNEKEDDSKIGIEKKKLEQALKNARLEHQVIVKQYIFPIGPIRIWYGPIKSKLILDNWPKLQDKD